MTEEEFIENAVKSFGNPVTTLLEALEEHYLNGFYDEVTGDVDAPMGHNYSVDRWIVMTDTQGFKSVNPYPSIEAAEKEMAHLSTEYAEWSDVVEYR